MVQVGQIAPGFSLPSTTGEIISLDDYRGKNVVLYFYPRDMTPGCTTEACDFRDNHAKFADVNTVVLGISPDPVDSHQRFTEKHDLPFPLLADTEHEVAEKYGAWQLKKNFGKEYMGIQRSTFVIDEQGDIAKMWLNVKADGHVQDVYNTIKELFGS